MDRANLLEFKTHQLWVDRVLKVRLQTPPAGYTRTSCRQVLEADKKLFEELANATRHGVQATVNGRPLDLVFEDCANKPEEVHLLQPLMGKSTEYKSEEKPAPNRPSSYRLQDPRKRKSKGKTQGKSKGSPKMHLVLLNGGCRATTNAGDAICYGFNLGTCTNKVNAGRCDRRYHLCVLPKCGKHPAYVKCPTKSLGS